MDLGLVWSGFGRGGTVEWKWVIGCNCNEDTLKHLCDYSLALLDDLACTCFEDTFLRQLGQISLLVDCATY